MAKTTAQRNQENANYFRNLWKIKLLFEEQGNEEFAHTIDETFDRFINISNIRSIESIQEKMLSRIGKNRKRNDISQLVLKHLLAEDKFCLNCCNDIIANGYANDDRIADAEEFVKSMQKQD